MGAAGQLNNGMQPAAGMAGVAHVAAADCMQGIGPPQPPSDDVMAFSQAVNCSGTVACAGTAEGLQPVPHVSAPLATTATSSQAGVSKTLHIQDSDVSSTLFALSNRNAQCHMLQILTAHYHVCHCFCWNVHVFVDVGACDHLRPPLLQHWWGHMQNTRFFGMRSSYRCKGEESCMCSTPCCKVQDHLPAACLLCGKIITTASSLPPTGGQP